MDASLNRRHLLQALAVAGLGAGPLLLSRTLADEHATNGTRMVAAVFFDSYATAALKDALRYAGEDGFVASLPQLLHARVNADYDNIVWNTWFTANSEESVVTTPQGHHVVVVVHGGGIFATPKRLERSYRADLDRSNSNGLTGQYAAKITSGEARDLLDQGKLPDGSAIPMYAYDEISQGISEMPTRHGIVLDYQLAKKSTSGYELFRNLRRDPLMIARAGGPEAAEAYLDKAAARHGTRRMGSFHPFNRIDPDQPQTRLLNLGGNQGGLNSEGKDEGLGLGYDLDWGISGNNGLVDMARYVAVAPRDPAKSLQYLDFEL